MYGMYQSPYSGMNPVNMYQQRLQQMQQQYPQPYSSMPQAQSGLKGRIVTGMEEARAAQIDLDGSVFVFPSLSENKIYTKTIDLNGNPVFEVYHKSVQQETKQPVYAESGAVIALQQRVEKLEKLLQGVSVNVQSNANDVPTNVWKQSDNATSVANGSG
ncbi:MAG: hypothetical protein IJZ69_04190 [Bacteroidales bacterium]|nr:hypothetical protein [Bacteroidales bacterium]